MLRLLEYYDALICSCRFSEKRLNPIFSVLRDFILTWLLLNLVTPREDKGKRGNPPYRPCPHHNPSEVIFRRYRFLADNVTSRVTCLSPFSILQRLITILHFHKRIQIASRVTSNESLRNTHNLKANRM